jgi:hypothetical protein
MTNFLEFKDFFKGLTRVYSVTFQLRDTHGELFFDTADKEPIPDERMRQQAFAVQVARGQEFQHSEENQQIFRYGIPVWGDRGMEAILIASQCVNNNGQPQGNKAPASAGDMKLFLSETADLIAYKCNVQAEVEDMARALDKSFEELHLYSNIATQIKTLQFSREMLRNLIGEILKTMRADLAFAILPDRPQYNVIEQRRQLFKEDKKVREFIHKVIHLIPQDAPSLKENYYIVNDSRAISQFKPLLAEVFRLLLVRVQHAGQFYGWLGLVSVNMNEIFRRSELKLLTSIAEQIGIVIANSDLYKEFEQFMVNIVKSLVYAIEAKDVYTRGHSERVSRYSMELGEKLGFTGKQKIDLQWASILHDIGKIGIPERILNKPDQLNDEEFAIIKRHPVKGAKILTPINQLARSLPGIQHHHERFDGNGYPDGLKGRDIPILARIIAVADTFDAIVSTRAYRQAMQPQKAMRIIAEVAGTQLDPDIVEVFGELFDQGLIKKRTAR